LKGRVLPKREKFKKGFAVKSSLKKKKREMTFAHKRKKTLRMQLEGKGGGVEEAETDRFWSTDDPPRKEIILLSPKKKREESLFVGEKKGAG